jgi:Sulfotransferase domain
VTRHLLVIGAQRCGTTYLAAMLDAHPEVTMARPSRPEPKVFLRDDDADRGLGWYRSRYFAHATGQTVLGEKSTSYLEHPEAARRAADVLGRAEILAVLRDPVARAVSNWRFSTENGLEDRPLSRALSDNLLGAREWDPRATSASPYAYLERGHYSRHLAPWYAAFPGSVHVCFFEELVGSADALAALYAAVGVDVGFRPRLLRCRVNESTGPPPSLEPDLLRRLRGHFAGSDEELRRRLGRQLPWDGAAGHG